MASVGADRHGFSAGERFADFLDSIGLEDLDLVWEVTGTVLEAVHPVYEGFYRGGLVE